jgi:hypothetical protein
VQKKQKAPEIKKISKNANVLEFKNTLVIRILNTTKYNGISKISVLLRAKVTILKKKKLNTW